MHRNNNKSENTKPLNITALILAGGGGERLGGADKGLVEYLTKPLVEHVIDALRPQVSNMIISINRNHDTYKQFGYDLVIDRNEAHQGPMAGIVAAIEYLNDSNMPENDAILVSPCDTPKLPNSYVAKLINHIDSNRPQPSITVVHDGERRQNLHCLLRRDSWDSLCAFYAEGNRAMHKWYEQIGVSEVDFSAQANSFVNINYPDQLSL